MPIPPFKELWNLYLNGDKEDSFGAVHIIAKMYAKELISELQSSKGTQENNKLYFKKLLKLKTNPVVINCLNSAQIISAIDSKLNLV